VIAHKIQRRAAHDLYGRLGRYVLGVSHAKDERLFQSIADYIAFDDAGGHRVRDPRITNCGCDRLGDAIKEIEATQGQSRRSSADKTYHLIISFQQDERPDLAVLRDIEDQLCAAIGLGEHQRISAIHEDTENLHIHVAINKVHPVTLRTIEPYRDMPKLMEACVALEIQHGLQRDNHGVRFDKEKDKGLEQKGRGGGRDEKMEAYAGRESLKSWIAEHAAMALGEAGRTAGSWNELHKRMADFGLNLVPRGAGFVVAAEGRRAAVKASDVSPDLAFKALTQRLGSFQAPGADIGETEPSQAYEAKPVHELTRSEALFKVYQAERASAVEARTKAQAETSRANGAYAKTLQDYHQNRRRILADSWTVTGKTLRLKYEELGKERRTDWLQQAALRKAQRIKIATDHPIPTWQGWLQQRAEKGDVGALEVLRSRQWGKETFERDVLEASDEASVKTVILARHKPKVRRNGDVHYALQDGSRVIDKRRAVHAEGVTMASAALSLILARGRFVGPITVTGDERYRQAILDAAVTYGFEIRFKDQELEAQRQAGLSHARSAEQPEPPSKGASRQSDLRKGASLQGPERGDEGARAYVDERNELRLRRPEIQDIPPHRLWSPSDAGPATYIRNVRFADHDSEGVILSKGDAYLVKPVTAAQAARAGAHFQRGAMVSLDARGRFVQAPDRNAARSGLREPGLDR